MFWPRVSVMEYLVFTSRALELKFAPQARMPVTVFEMQLGCLLMGFYLSIDVFVVSGDREAGSL
jgi:hypothetical protein